MNDHVESLQIDLNSIKEFLSNQSFNQVDAYTLNNVSIFLIVILVIYICTITVNFE